MTFKIAVLRIESRIHEFVVEADSEKEGEEKALSEAADYDFTDVSYFGSDYVINHIQKI